MVQTKKLLILLLKVCVSLGLISCLLWKVGIKNLIDSLAGINPLHLVLAAVVMFLLLTLAALRWRLCLSAQGIHISVGSTLNYSLIGFFFNNFAPSTVGGDVAKGVMVSRFSKKKLGTAISIVMDRLIGFLATGLMALFALAVSFNLPLDNRLRLAILLFAGLVMLLLFLVFHKGLSHKAAGFLSSHHLQNVADKIVSVSNAISIYRTYPNFIKKALVLSLGMQIGNISAGYLLALGLGIKISFLYFVVFTPLIMAVMSIPISLNGLGLREGAYVGFFSLAGVPKEGSLAISIAYYAIVLFVSLIGGGLLLRSGFKKRKEKND